MPVAIGLGRTQDIEFLAERFEPFRGQHVANGAGPGVYMGPVELQLGLAAAALGHLDAGGGGPATRPRSATPTAPAGTPCRPASNSPRRWPAGRRPATWTRPRPRWTPPRARPNSSGWSRSPSRIGQLRARLPATTAARSPLSPRELEVARLVARGLTNKQIGQDLYVSERTAENHVQHILAKLGFSNRSQIATWASGEHDAGRRMSTQADGE